MITMLYHKHRDSSSEVIYKEIEPNYICIVMTCANMSGPSGWHGREGWRSKLCWFICVLIRNFSDLLMIISRVLNYL